MKKAMANKWKGIVFFTLLFSFLLLAGSRPVSARQPVHRNAELFLRIPTVWYRMIHSVNGPKL